MSEIPGPGFGGFLIKAYIASHPPLALAALLFAAIGRALRDHGARRARVHDLAELHALGGAHGLGFSMASPAFETPGRIIAFPLMAACAIALAARDRRLGSPPCWSAFPRCTGLRRDRFRDRRHLYGF